MKYQGQILDGQMHGDGKLTYDNGEYYDGEWVKGKRYSWTYQQGFNTEFFSGKRHGRGEYMYADGTKYVGNWENDRIQGEGTSWYPNGNKWV